MTKDSSSNIVFVSANVADYQTLVNGVELGTEVFVLDANRNGIEQITEVLANHSNLDSVQILSHGDEGSLQLGNTNLDDGNLDSYQNQLQQWGEALIAGGDILLYGCNVAAGELGEAFIDRLSQITMADIAASNDLTGNSALGGDWILEATTGLIEAPLAFQAEVMSAFNSVLALIKVTTNVDSLTTNTNDIITLREAIIEAINNGVADIIDLSQIAGQTIELKGSLPTITRSIEFKGNGVTIDGQDKYQIVAIDATGSNKVIFSDLTLRDGYARGGDGEDGTHGAGGGGGGLGAGGAVFIHDGTVYFKDVEFESNIARGGNGGNGGDPVLGTFLE